MHFDEATAENLKLDLPAELLAEVNRRNNKARPADFNVEAWQPSLLDRLARMLGLG